ncbi:hypothetical protein [Dethiothermospora halolimnae]|uniref:hypothetical protein n=1 Tax=Dethiothermospora halolimnae TaxID=3114390 RepID=UPI003CCC3313
MGSDNHIDSLAKRLIKQLGLSEDIDNLDNKKDNKDGSKKKSCINLSASNLLVIAGLLSGALTVDSLLVDARQEIQIVLTGSLKQKTELEKMMDQIGTMPFDEVVKAIVGRF